MDTNNIYFQFAKQGVPLLKIFEGFAEFYVRLLCSEMSADTLKIRGNNFYFRDQTEDLLMRYY